MTCSACGRDMFWEVCPVCGYDDFPPRGCDECDGHAGWWYCDTCDRVPEEEVGAALAAQEIA